jgi:glycosyltransferase involved in cell wall biosynthesis
VEVAPPLPVLPIETMKLNKPSFQACTSNFLNVTIDQLVSVAHQILFFWPREFPMIEWIGPHANRYSIENADPAHGIEFLIVVPTYNAQDWIIRCLESIRDQRHEIFRCVVIDDASSDETANRLKETAWLYQDQRFTVVHNEKNQRALANIVRGFQLLKSADRPESVLVLIDGDDWLFSDFSLAIVAAAYHQTNCWLTYGNFVTYPTGRPGICKPFPESVVKTGSFRKYSLVASHLRTFKSHLFHAIKDSDLRNPDGNYFTVTYDQALMIPMLEMAAERLRFLDHFLYVYNRYNPLNDDRVRGAHQYKVEQYIRQMPVYERLPDRICCSSLSEKPSSKAQHIDNEG